MPVKRRLETFPGRIARVAHKTDGLATKDCREVRNSKHNSAIKGNENIERTGQGLTVEALHAPVLLFNSRFCSKKLPQGMGRLNKA